MIEIILRNAGQRTLDALRYGGARQVEMVSDGTRFHTYEIPAEWQVGNEIHIPARGMFPGSTLVEKSNLFTGAYWTVQ